MVVFVVAWAQPTPQVSLGMALAAIAVALTSLVVGEENQRPRIEEFVVYPVPGRFYEGELNIRRDPVTQELPDWRWIVTPVPGTNGATEPENPAFVPALIGLAAIVRVA